MLQPSAAQQGSDSANRDVAASALARLSAVERLAARQAVVLRTLASLLDPSDPESGFLALADELRLRFQCERVAIGSRAAGFNSDSLRATLTTLSQQADFDRKTADVGLFEAVMAEAMALDRLVVVHAASADADPAIAAHLDLLRHTRAHEVVTLPLVHDQAFAGAIVLIRTDKKPLSPALHKLLRQLGALLAPALQLRQRESETLPRHLQRSMTDVFSWTLSTQQLGLKITAIAIAFFLITTAIWPATWRIGAAAELIPVERRLVSVPFNGFIKAVHVDTGALVTTGTPLIELDTTELELELARWTGEVRGASTEMRAAMASADRKEVAVLAARVERAQAQLDLVKSQLARAVITAPVNGLVTSEDLSQATGAAVERGQPLLEIAPDGAWKTVLWVDETDIGFIKEGQTGQLVLRSMPGDGLPLEIVAIHPIATARDGANRFRVEATLTAEALDLRPGQTGYAKVNVGTASLLWQWTHRFTDWVSASIWAATG